jgi:hypothetical protein
MYNHRIDIEWDSWLKNGMSGGHIHYTWDYWSRAAREEVSRCQDVERS